MVMDIASFERREKMLKLREELLAVEEDRLHGEKGYSVSDVSDRIQACDANAGLPCGFFGKGQPGGGEPSGCFI